MIKEKQEQILKQLKEEGIEFDVSYLSPIVISGYMNELKQHGIIDSDIVINSSGKKVIEACNKFGWIPTDEEIQSLVLELINGSDQPIFVYLLKRYRDDKDSLIKEFKESQESNK